MPATPTERLDFLVQGSAPEPYQVTFIKTGSKINAYCTCPAGQVGQYCKHRTAIIFANVTNIVSDNAQDVDVLQSWLPGSNIEQAFKAIKEAEKLHKQATARLTKAKKDLAKTMCD